MKELLNAIKENENELSRMRNYPHKNKGFLKILQEKTIKRLEEELKFLKTHLMLID